MYIKRNMVYAEPGKRLIHLATGTVCYQGTGTDSDYEEVDSPVRKIEIVGNLAVWGNGYCAVPIKVGGDYSYYKAALVKLRYSNDDQIAVMLNGEDVELERMQRWRTWAADVAKAICARLALPC